MSQLESVCTCQMTCFHPRGTGRGRMPRCTEVVLFPRDDPHNFRP